MIVVGSKATSAFSYTGYATIYSQQAEEFFQKLCSLWHAFKTSITGSLELLSLLRAKVFYGDGTFTSLLAPPFAHPRLTYNPVLRHARRTTPEIDPHSLNPHATRPCPRLPRHNLMVRDREHRRRPGNTRVRRARWLVIHCESPPYLLLESKG